MMDYTLVELGNDSKYVLLDMFIYDSKKYVLLSRFFDDNIDNLFDICLYNDENNYFEPIDDEVLYNDVKDIFENRLIQQKIKNIDNENFVKLKVVGIDGYNYSLEKPNGEVIIKNIEFYGDIKIKINNYIYMLESTVLERNMFQYGSVVNNRDEIIKIVDENSEYYLQRYYG